MATEVQDKMVKILPAELADAAVDLSERAGSREYCFPVNTAQVILRLLLHAGVVPVGGDLWVRDKGDGYFPAGEGWYVDSVEGESLDDRAERVRQTATRFFDLHSGMQDACVTFVIKP